MLFRLAVLFQRFALRGVIKLALVVALLCWACPAFSAAVVVLGVFVAPEVYRATRTGSLLLPVLAVVDVAVIVLVWREYRRLPVGSPQ